MLEWFVIFGVLLWAFYGLVLHIMKSIERIKEVKSQIAAISTRKPLLILDMNNVLVYRAFAPTQAQEKPESVPFNDQATLLGGKFYTWKRPHLDTFLDYCFNNFTVAVWSSALGRNVNDLVDFVFGEERKSKLLFVWDQSHCDAVVNDTSNSGDANAYSKPLFKKPLAKVWAAYPELRSLLQLKCF
jgi:hypothetical protein